MQPRLGGLPVPAWLRTWWPALLWACFIFMMSTDSFSAQHTGWFFEPILRWLFPSFSADRIDFIHHIIRKSAHFTEYFIFCILIYRGVRGDRKGWRWTWGIAALSVAAGYSIMDEIHQAFVVSRTASPYDSLLDSIGAFFAFAALWLWFRLRRPKPDSLPGQVSDPTSAPSL
jgi:VanZ family protein